LLLLLGIGLKLDPRNLPSPLIDKPAPAFNLQSLHEPGREVRRDDLIGQVSLLNVWASWCGVCREEHPLLVSLARDRQVPVYGLNYKDTREEALAWLQRFGDPYRAIAFDPDGRTGIDYGVYGVPETYVIDTGGVIRYKHVGPLNADVLNDTIIPLIERLGREGS
jgi:cytochrome c biogenesis protein CcmG/thiol:disulfide interchange protein DsbE